jgi:hypothetical protein
MTLLLHPVGILITHFIYFFISRIQHVVWWNFFMNWCILIGGWIWDLNPISTEQEIAAIQLNLAQQRKKWLQQRSNILSQQRLHLHLYLECIEHASLYFHLNVSSFCISFASIPLIHKFDFVIEHGNLNFI